MLQSQAPIMKISTFVVCFILVYVRPDDNAGETASDRREIAESRTEYLKINGTQNFNSIEAGSTPSLTCKILVEGEEVWWRKGDKNQTSVAGDTKLVKTLNIRTASSNDEGNYTCFAKLINGTEVNHTIYIRVIERREIIGGQGAREKTGSPANLSCNVRGRPPLEFSWVKIGNTENSEQLKNFTQIVILNDTQFTMNLNFPSVTYKENGTYECSIKDYKSIISHQVPLIVTDSPRVNIDFVKPIGASSVYIKWTVDDRNDPVQNYLIQQIKNGTEEWQYYPEGISGKDSSFILKNLVNNSAYQFKIQARNSVGLSHAAESQWVTTLKEDPEFIPTVSVKGTSITSITIGWSAPPTELKDLVHYYEMKAHHVGDDPRQTIHIAEATNIYEFENLSSGTNYSLQVAACSEYTKKCGNWSIAQEGHTMDGVASPPRNVSVKCNYDITQNSGSVFITWVEPGEPNGKITRYKIALTGVAEYKNDMGNRDIDNWRPPDISVDGNKMNKSIVYENVLLNTNYTVRISGVTRLRALSGQEENGTCRMPAGKPSKENLNMRSWRKVQSQDQKLFKLNLPRISERNGSICCYRVFIVKLAYLDNIRNLPDPKDIEVYNYQHVHRSTSNGAYLAEMFNSDELKTEIFIGDDETFNSSKSCLRCIGLKPKAQLKEQLPTLDLVPGIQPTVTVASLTNATATPGSIQIPEKSVRKKRDDGNEIPFAGDESESNLYLPMDGALDERANYTGFIEVMVYGSEAGQFYSAYSGYLEQQGFFSDLEDKGQSSSFGIMMQICIALLIIVLVILMGMCILHKYLKNARQGGEEIISLRNSFRHLCRTLRGRHQLVASNPPDMPPISRTDLLQAYIDRHRDSDYGFQHEFELLPDRFADRTTRASEARENLYKNRYPDIKCYDQTRVRLVQVDGICGSDYINANFVLGYKERKKFICAQGPMENTVCDYWRMIWEQHLELVLMLTNLEEYSKTKCAKYWPDKSESKSFGDITVEHVREIPYSDYVVRELKMTRTGERESRIIIQHHFLVWKDFMAPEHPHAILRFIKRVNEAYSLEKGPILVHCSAGVGRTGTLVALDSLLQQLTEEGQVSIFNTVCDLRHQRNFLVQSLKQYIFVYRALMEMAQFGDTEISANQLKTIVERLRQRENGKDKSRMEEEYEKISSVLEDRKSFSVGSGDENRIKNRNELVIPYDRNRVILTPVPGREHSTYINASFIEGYDNSESFIITQDPLETTVPDFWRMISEQCASTIVMLSDLSEGPRKCPRYWPDDEIAYDHIRVRYIQSESCPYYTRRELCLLNSKTDESMVVTQYHYHGWPTVEGEVPEVTRGLIELVDQTIANDVELGGPLVVHCNCGSDRSSMFVALSILVQQLRTERRVDIFTTTKKLRSQRHGMIGTFAQYEFLHRAIVNYSDLHNLAEEEPTS